MLYAPDRQSHQIVERIVPRLAAAFADIDVVAIAPPLLPPPSLSSLSLLPRIVVAVVPAPAAPIKKTSIPQHPINPRNALSRRHLAMGSSRHKESIVSRKVWRGRRRAGVGGGVLGLDAVEAVAVGMERRRGGGW